MRIEPTGFEGLFILEPKAFGDDRGYFLESYNRKTLLAAGIDTMFIQDNESSSRKGVLRGLHYQNAPHAQTKLIRVLSGVILDVALDLRRSQPTFGKHFSVELSSSNRKQLLVPKGFAHGFVVLSDNVVVLYKCDEFYHPESEGGVLYDDPDLGIDWKLDRTEITLSAKDKANPPLSKAPFRF